jgi:hypothetical protein
MKLLLFGLASLVYHALPAQKNLIPASHSTLTGIALPQGSKLDKRILYRAAAKATLDMEAKDAGIVLSDNYEVFLLPASSGNSMSDSIITQLEKNNWNLSASAKDAKWGQIEKAGKKCLLYFDGKEKESWLYIAELSEPSLTPRPTDAGAQISNPPKVNKPPDISNPSENTIPAGFTFVTTNFDDGWTATEKPAWVEVTKGSTTVLIHLANKAIDMSSADSKTITANAWDVLVAPRYKSMSNFYLFGGNISYNRTTAVSANLVDQEGRSFYVVLFRKGASNWMEFITPDKATFIQQFGMDISQANNENLIYSEEAQWETMLAMQHRNKFAVSISDLIGHWDETSGSYANMYYTSTGNYAGMNAVTNNAQFWIAANGTYRSEHKGTSGMVGSTQFFQEKYNGKVTMLSNWQLSLSDRYNGKTETYWCQFEIVSSGRILHLTNAEASGIQYHLGKVK